MEWMYLSFKFHLNFSRMSNYQQSSVATMETVSPEGTFCDTVQIPSSVGDMELI